VIIKRKENNESVYTKWQQVALKLCGNWRQVAWILGINIIMLLFHSFPVTSASYDVANRYENWN